MPRKTDNLSPRQRQSQQIMREKAAKKRKEEWRRRFKFVGGAVLGVLVVGIASFSWYSGALATTIEQMKTGMYRTTVHAGLAVNALHVEGRNRTPMTEVMAALQVRKNDPILALSLTEMRDRLQVIPSVREAAVERALPNQLYVRIVEREPVALWQHNNELSLVDDKGVIMQGLDISPYRHLPLIVGEGAPAHVAELMDVLEASPEIAKQFASAIRVGDRRWNIRLQNEVELKLPEDDAVAALAKLAKMDAEEKLLARAIKVIDLRVQGKVFIKLSPALTQSPVHEAEEI